MAKTHSRTLKLETGKRYDLGQLQCVDWTEGDGSGHEGYNWHDYFDAKGGYLGPDPSGIEPVLEAKGNAVNHIETKRSG